MKGRVRNVIVKRVENNVSKRARKTGELAVESQGK